MAFFISFAGQAFIRRIFLAVASKWFICRSQMLKASDVSSSWFLYFTYQNLLNLWFSLYLASRIIMKISASKIFLAKLQSVTKIVRLAPSLPLFKFSCKLADYFWSSLPRMASSCLAQH